MGSSCTTSSKSSCKKNEQTMKKYQNTNIKNNFSVKNNNHLSKEVFEECFMRINKLSNANTNTQLHFFNQAKTSLTQKQQQAVDIIYSSKQKQQLGDDLQNQKELSPQSTNCPNMNSCATSMKFDSPKTSLNFQKTSINQLRRKISYTEIFILERKRYMQEKGIYNYTPYTVLPAPKLKKLQSNPLFKKRKSSLANIPSSIMSNDNGTLANATTQVIKTMSINSLGSSQNEFSIQRKENTPAIMPKGDTDIIKIDI